MAAAAGRSYRIVHYAPRQRVFMRTVRLQWSWDWRYSRDPVAECRAAVECRQTLMDRARQITDEINGQISRGDVPAGRRFALVDTQDSSFRQVIDQTQVVGLPLNGRNFRELGLIVPGVQEMSQNSNAPPRKDDEPDLLTTATTPPEAKPTSAP